MTQPSTKSKRKSDALGLAKFFAARPHSFRTADITGRGDRF
jgi:hypothetical protein